MNVGIDVSSNNGHLDAAYALLNQRTYPSWLYPITRGATRRICSSKKAGSFWPATRSVIVRKRASEIAVQWNQQGPPGPMGPQGPQGPRGPDQSALKTEPRQRWRGFLLTASEDYQRGARANLLTHAVDGKSESVCLVPDV